MCGLVGLVTKWNSGTFSKDVEIFKTMLFLDTLRGDDGTGVCIVNNEAGATVFKKSTDYPSFQYNGDLKKGLQESISSGKALLGHNRKATVGSHVDENAHPFVFDDRYVFFHNGTLTNHKQFGDTEVDSEAFGKAITECEGDIEKLNEVFSKAKGAWACVWYDSVKHTLYFTRNDQRPLNLIWTDSGNLLYASEAWMATIAATRAAEKCKETIALKDWVLYSVELSVANDLKIVEQPLTKKAPVIAIPHGSHRKSKNTGGKHTSAVNLSKEQGKDTIVALKRQTWVGFFVSDAQCQAANVSTIETAVKSECYDWILFGTHPEHPGVCFSGVLQNCFPYEVNKLISEGGYVHGYFTDAEYSKGKVDCWIDEVYNVGAYVC